MAQSAASENSGHDEISPICDSDYRALRQDSARDGQELLLTSVNNLASLGVDVDAGVDSALSGSENLRINMATTDAQSTDILLHHFSGGRPVSVTRNGTTHADEVADVWSWDERSSRLTLFGSSDVGSVDWEIDVR